MSVFLIAGLVFLGSIPFVFPWRNASSAKCKAGQASSLSTEAPTSNTKADERRQTSSFKFPQDPVLTRLLFSPHHEANTSDPIIHDARGFRKSYPELLRDILKTAQSVKPALPRSTFDQRGLLKDSSPYIGVLVRSGYEYIVAFFAIRAIGGACVPIASGILPEEACYLVSKSKATCILAGKDCERRAADICTLAGAQGDNLSWLPISSNADPTPTKDHDLGVEIDTNLQLDPSGPGLLLFTSGTTGLPKGVVLPRQCLGAPGAVRGSPGGTAVSFRACHWIAGALGLVRPILEGMTLHVLDENAGAEGLLAAMMHHRFTAAAFTPTLLRQMKNVMLSQGGDIEQYAAAFQYLPAISCSAAPIETSLREFWTGLTGLPFENIYSMTETGGMVCRAVSRPNGSIGQPIPGREIKLSDGDRGEILVKSPTMFTHYIGDEEKTKAAFDQDGFYKTGDMAELRDGELFFAGRATTDYISFRYFRIPALVVEASLMDLPYVADACVLGVPYHEARQLCGAVIQLQREGSKGALPPPQVNLARIRSDLAGVVAAYMLPVVLRVLRDGEQLPRTYSGKPIKKRILGELLGTTEWFPAEDLPDGVEYCGCEVVSDKDSARPWDWGGMQCAR